MRRVGGSGNWENESDIFVTSHVWHFSFPLFLLDKQEGSKAAAYPVSGAGWIHDAVWLVRGVRVGAVSLVYRLLADPCVLQFHGVPGLLPGLEVARSSTEDICMDCVFGGPARVHGWCRVHGDNLTFL